MAKGGGNVPQFTALYVGDLHPEVTEAMLHEIFNAVGPVGSVRVCRDNVTRKSLGYGYVNFHTVADADRALDALNYSSIKGRACRIMKSQRDPSMRKSSLGNIFVKNLDRNIDNKALYDTFSLFGNILSCKVNADPTGKSYGYGFVHYETEEAAKQAIERVNGMQIGEQTVEVTWFKKWEEREPGDCTNVYVKNLPDDTDDEKLAERFGAYGEIVAKKILEDKNGRKFAFVNYKDVEAAKKAIAEEHGKDLRTEEEKKVTKGDANPDYHLLYVQRAQNKAERARELRKNAPPKVEDGVNLFVKNLSASCTTEALKELFAPFGNVSSCAAMADDKGKCKGFGFVCYSTSDEATKAVTEMHLKIVNSKPLYVGLAEKKEDRAERLRQRDSAGAGGFVPGMGGKGFAGCKGFDGGKGKGKKGGGMNPSQGMGGAMGNLMMGMAGKGVGPQMAGQKGGMMGPMMGKGNPMMGMMNPMMMMGKGNPMMGMLGKGGPMGMPGPMGMMHPMMPNPMMMGARPPAGGMAAAAGQARPPAAVGGPGAPLTAAALAAAPVHVQKQMLGEKLFPAIQRMQPELAGKITGMMLEMDNSELLILLESEQQLRGKVDEAVKVLRSP